MHLNSHELKSKSIICSMWTFSSSGRVRPRQFKCNLTHIKVGLCLIKWTFMQYVNIFLKWTFIPTWSRSINYFSLLDLSQVIVFIKIIKVLRHQPLQFNLYEFNKMHSDQSDRNLKTKVKILKRPLNNLRFVKNEYSTTSNKKSPPYISSQVASFIFLLWTQSHEFLKAQFHPTNVS